jgi:hypothetical protein
VKFTFSSETALNNLLATAAVGSTTPIEEASESVLEWLGRVRMLIGVPFEYLVPDEGLLRPETIRFFYVDRNWTDAAVDGAIAAGAYGTRDRVTLQQRHQEVRSEVDSAERNQRVGGEDVTGQAAANLAGFLLRSRAVSGWPGMHVRGWRGDRRLVIMRMERLAPAVMLVIFDDIPDRMEIEEPRQGIQFGVRSARTGEPAGSWWLDVRSPSTGTTIPGRDPVRAPFRKGSSGVLHMTELRRRLALEPELGPTLTSAETALQLLRFPYRQLFGPQPGVDFGELLDSLFTIDDLTGWLEVGPHG